MLLFKNIWSYFIGFLKQYGFILITLSVPLLLLLNAHPKLAHRLLIPETSSHVKTAPDRKSIVSGIMAHTHKCAFILHI
jgi:hypothetical protein